MIKLTERRYQEAKEVLHRYRNELLERRSTNLKEFERELLGIWGLGYRELKNVIIDLSRRDGYEMLAVKYMERGAPAVVSEFKQPLASIYGIPDYNSEERKRKQQEYWERAFST